MKNLLISALFVFWLVVGNSGSELETRFAEVDHTPAVEGNGMALMWVIQDTQPEGVAVLGQRYDEIWADQTKCAIYDSIYPRTKSDNPLAPQSPPKAFCVFAGCEKEMGL